MFRTNPLACLLIVNCACALVYMDRNHKTSHGLYLNEPCTNEHHPAGVCTLVPQCPPADRMLQRYSRHNFDRCGFHGPTEIVCCPNPSSPNALSLINSDSSGGEEVRARSRLEKSCKDYNKLIGTKISPFILGGTKAGIGEFPHMAALGYDLGDDVLSYACGASLISDQYVLTAAHCVRRSDERLPVKVKLGTLFLNNTSEFDYDVGDVIVHPDYNSKERYNDIALVKLARPLKINDRVAPACVPLADPTERVGYCVSGWGVTDNEKLEQSNTLLKANLNIVALSDCQPSYEKRSDFRLSRGVVETMMCASGKDVDACQGDSGGPLQVRVKTTPNIWTVVGITSFGIGCGSKTPGVYTRVASYASWIEKQLWP